MKLEGKRTSPAEYEKYAGREIKIKMQLCVELLLGPPSRMWEKERRGAVKERRPIFHEIRSAKLTHLSQLGHQLVVALRCVRRQC